MRLRLWLSAAPVLVMLDMAYVEAAQTVPACLTLKAGNTRILTENLDCSSHTAKGSVGVLMATNSTLDCAGYAIIGPVTEYDDERDRYFGIYAEKKKKVTVKNCNVYHYDRGLYFLNVKRGRVNDSNFYSNTCYGANIAGKGSFDNWWDGNTYHDNGDEGIHISGPFLKAKTKPNRFTNSSAYNNRREGWYLLNVNAAEISGVAAASGLAAHDNGGPGFYMKHSHHNQIHDFKMYRDVFEITGESDFNTISNVTVIRGQVRIGKYEGEVANVAYPDYNVLDRVCVRHEDDIPSIGFNFVGVTDGYNIITNSETLLASVSADPIKATETTTHNSLVDLYISPPDMTNDIEVGSSFDMLTMQTTTRPTCYGD